MFDLCPVIGNKECPFSVRGIYCGIEKGSGEIKDIKSCNRKEPKYEADIYQKDIRGNKAIRKFGKKDKTRDLFR